MQYAPGLSGGMQHGLDAAFEADRLPAGGVSGALIRSHDWTATLGPVANWPAPLAVIVGVMLGSRQPMFVTWGSERTLIYNDGYAELLGAKHPDALGRPFLDVWSEIRRDLQPMLDEVDAGGSIAMDDIALIVERHGYQEEAHFTFSYNPLRDESGHVAGLFCPCLETTASVLSSRQNLAERERLKQLFEQAPGFMAMLRGPEHVFELVNPTYLQLVGHRDLIGKPVREAFPEIAGQGYLELLDRVFSEGEAFRGSAMPVGLQRTPGGPVEERFIDLVYQPVTGTDGQVTGIFAEGYDVTERVAAEAALRESAADYQNAAELNPQVAWTATPDGQLDRVAERWQSWTGTTGLGDSWGQGLHADDLAPTTKAWIRSVTTGEPYDVEHRVKRLSGDYRWARSRAFPRRDANGQILKWYGSTEDIHEQKLAEERLRESEARFRTVAEAMPGFVWTADAKGNLDYTSPRWHQYSGLDPQGSLGQGWASSVHPDDTPLALERWQAAVSAGTPYEVEFRLRRADGVFRWWLTRALPSIEEGGALRWVGVATELEDIIAARETLARSREDLEQRVEERTRELRAAEDQLRQAQKMEAVGQLTGGIAHDFNNLLAGIVGSLDLMQTRIAQGRVDGIERFSKAAMSSAQRAAALTHRLLAFARRQPLDPKPVDANHLVTSMEDLLRRTIGPAHALELVTAGGLWTTLCDPNQLESALLNLAINARDAMPEGGKLTIETANAHLDSAYAAAQRDLAPGQYVAICVSDTGTGMSPAVIARATEPFYTTKPLGQGTGLGLSMVYGFAKQSEGHLRIYSEEGQGTTVKIYLPRHRGGAAVEHASVEPGPLEASAQAGEAVLVVEDEPVVRALIVEVLQDLGFQALEASDGPGGLRLLQSSRRIDLLITDVGLPGLNGRQLADQARERRPDLKVLFVTGYAENATLANGFLEPRMEMITKPFAIDALANKIRNILRGN